MGKKNVLHLLLPELKEQQKFYHKAMAWLTLYQSLEDAQVP